MKGEPSQTYFARAQADADLAIGGRFKKEIATKVTGVPVYPALPANSPWHNDPVPREEPLGLDVHAVPDLGFERAPAGCPNPSTVLRRR